MVHYFPEMVNYFPENGPLLPGNMDHYFPEELTITSRRMDNYFPENGQLLAGNGPLFRPFNSDQCGKWFIDAMS